MTTSARHENQLLPEWLDALAILRQAVDGQSITQLWEKYCPKFENSVSNKLIDIDDGEDDETDIWINTAQEWQTLPKIERIEILTYAAVCAWFGKVRDDDGSEQLCRKAGCYWKNTPTINERWRLIGYYTAFHLLPNSCFEDRPKCGVCEQPVATGSGATLDKRYRSNLHDSCYRFAHQVLAQTK